MKQHIYKLLLGPGAMIDGVCLLLTFGNWMPAMHYKAAKLMAIEKFKSMRKHHEQTQ